MRFARRLLTPLALALAACASAPEQGRVDVAPLDEPSYGALVHPVIERACGTADCHGKLPRGLRVYGATALRLPGEAGPTTPAEVRATYESILGLEPEKLNALVATSPRSKEQAEKLLLLAKPLAIERHRGGISLRKGEPAEQCILSWVLGQVDPVACTR